MCYYQGLLKGAAANGARRIRVHILTDGRDVLDGTSIEFVEQLEMDLKDLRTNGIDALIASGGGRMHVTMDRYEVIYCRNHVIWLTAESPSTRYTRISQPWYVFMVARMTGMW